MFPGGGPIHIVTAWNPGGEPCSPKQNRRRQKELLERLAELGLDVIRARPQVLPHASAAQTVALDLCRMDGGPWTGASQHAAAEWTVRRWMMLRALGCDVATVARLRRPAPRS